MLIVSRFQLSEDLPSTTELELRQGAEPLAMYAWNGMPWVHFRFDDDPALPTEKWLIHACGLRKQAPRGGIYLGTLFLGGGNYIYTAFAEKVERTGAA